MDETVLDRVFQREQQQENNEQLRSTLDQVVGANAPKVYEDMSFTEKLVNDWNYGRDAQNNAPKAGEEIMAAQRRVQEATDRLATFDKNDGTYEALYSNPDYEYDAAGERSRIEADIESANADFKNSIQKYAGIQKQISQYAQPKAIKDMLDKFDSMPIEKAVTSCISYMADKGITLETLANVGVSSFAGQSTEMFLGMIGGVAATYAAGPAAGKAVYSAATLKGSAQAELWGNIQEALQTKGYDLTNPEDVQRAFQDPELRKLYDKYTTRAAVVGGVDAASSLLLFEKIAPATAIRNMLLARRLQKTANVATKAAGAAPVRFADAFADAMRVPAGSMLGRAAMGAERIGTQAVLQGTLGAAGEGLGNVAIGEKTSPVNMFLEFFGEFAGSPVEVATASVAGASAEYNISRRQMMAEQAVKAQEAQFKFTQAAAALGEDIKQSEVVQQWADRVGADRTVWVDGSEVLAQEGLIEEVRAVNPETAAAIEKSAQDGQSVPMPIADIIKMAMANEEGAKQMIDNSRTFEDGMTPKQARAFMEAGEAKALEEELSKAERRISASQKLQREVSKVTNEYVNQLVAAGTDRNVARTLVKPWNWYLTARSKMTGMAPKDLADKLGIKIVRGKTGVNTVALTKGLSGEQNLRAEIANWEKTVDSLTAFPTGNVLMLKHTPLIMKLINGQVNPDSSFVLANHVFGGMFPNQNPNKSQHDHPEITADVIKQIPEKIVEPIAVFKQPIWKKGKDNKLEYDANGDKIFLGVRDDNYIFMLDVLVDGRTEILPVAIKFSKDGKHVLTVGKTAYGREASYKKAFSELEDNNLLVYADTQKVKGWNGTSVYNRLRGSNPNGSIVLTEQDLVKLKSLPENFGLYQRLSTADVGPQAIKKGAADPRFIRQWASLKALMGDAEQFATNLKLMRQLPGMKSLVYGLKNKEKVANMIIDRMADNLLFLYNKVPQDVRTRTRLWYDGGRKTAQEWATRYGLRPRQTAALIALYSPSNNWYNNLTMAERTLDIYYAYGDKEPSAATLKRANEIAKGKQGTLEGKTIKQLCNEGNMTGAACLLRAWDEVNNSSKLYVQTPEGGRGGYFSNPRAWMASIPRIADAISVIRNGSIDNVSRVIGSEFKVRNFYNNLYDPTNPYAATIDTHQVGASLLRVMAGGDIEVTQNFGAAGSASSKESGQKGTYAFYFEALQRAAEKAGVLPREMQSITWEAIRALFPAKTKKAMRPVIDAIWAKVDAGEMSIDDARKEIYDAAVAKNKEIGSKLGENDMPFTPWQETPYNDKVLETYDRGNLDIGEIVQPVPEPSLSLEVAPGTDDSELSVQARATWATLTDEEKQKVTTRVLPWVLEQVANETKTYISEPTLQLGGWEGTSNYSVVCTVADGGDYVKVASRLAELLHQDAVFAISKEQSDGMEPCKVVRIVLPNGFTEEQTKDLYENYIDKVRDADGNRLISGHSTSNGMMTFGVDASKIEEIRNGLDKVISAHPEKGFSVDVVDAFMGEIKGKENGENSLDDTGRERGVQQTASVGHDSNLQQETDKLVADTIAAVKAEREAAAAQGLAQSPVQQSVRLFMSGWDETLQQSAYHGSPYRFPKFTMDHIGEGEGAQAHGWGLYFTLTKGVAEEYRRRLSINNLDEYSVKIGNVDIFTFRDRIERQALKHQGEESQKFWDRLNVLDVYQVNGVDGVEKDFANYGTEFCREDTFKWFETEVKPNLHESGALYEVEIPNDDVMLVESLPIDKQSKLVQDALEKVMKEHDIYVPNGVVGGGIYAEISRILGGAKAASLALNKEGVKGIRYNGQQDGECAVVFDEDSIQILDYLEQQDKQGPRAIYYPRNTSGANMDIAGTIAMMEKSDKSSFLHESSHAWLDGDTLIAMSIAEKAAAGKALTRSERVFIRNLGEFFQWGQREGRIDLGVTSDPTTVFNAVARWSQMTLEEQRGMHELFAEGFERYLYDGSAPSEGLRAIFNRFREYLKEVYRNVENAPAPISREVRQMYDTMFFSEQAASDAEVRLEMQPLFDEAVEFTEMDEEERAEYRKLTEAARATTESIINRAEANARGEMREATFFETMKLKKERIEELTKRMQEVVERKAFKAYQLITSGEANLSAAEVERFTGSKGMSVILMQKGFAKADGDVTPEILAEMVGVNSSNNEAVLELLEDLFEMQPKNAVEKQAAKELIYEQNAETGEFDTTPSETGNLLAAHNDERSRLLTAEYNVIARMLGKQQVLVSSARDWATKKIQSLALKDLHPKAYMRDEAKNARLAEEAFRKGDYEAVLNYKRAQIAASEMARAALIEEQKQTVMRRRFTSAAKSSGVWGRVRSALHLLLQNHSMRDMTAKERAAFKDIKPAEFGEQLQADLLEAGVPVEGVSKWCSESKALQDMTVEEANEFYLMMQQLIGVGRSYMKQTLIADGLRVGEIVSKGREEIIKAQDEQGVDHEQDMAPQTSWEKFKDGASKFISWHLKAQSIFKVLDRNKYGFFWNLFVRSANERANFENTMRGEAHDKLAEILKGVKGNILKDEVRISGLGMLNKQQRMAIALNSGNQSNMQRLIEGDSRITGRTLMDVYASLTEEEWRAIEGIWKLFEEYRPLIAAKEVRVFGVEPEWIEFSPFTVQCKGGKTITVSGGYYPMVYDAYQSSRESKRQQASDAKEVLQASYQSATTKRSFTKSRADNPDGSRVDLTLAGMYNGLRDIIHDLAWHEWLIETKKVLDGVEGSAGGLRDDIRKAYGKNFTDVIEQWRKDIAQGERFANTDYGGRVAAFVRRGVGLAAMGWNPMTAVVQLTGIGYVVPKVGASHVLAAMTSFMKNPFALREAINNTSEFMKMRNITQNREISDIRNRLENKKNFIVDNAFFFTVMAQSIVDTIAWQAAYEKFMSEGQPEADAKAMADQVVIETQGSGNISDRAAVEREKGWTQILTPFYSFMNSAMNLNYQQIRGENNRVKKVAAVLWMSIAMPAIEQYLRDALKADAGEDDDDDDIVKSVVLKHGVRPSVEFALGQFVLFRELSSAAGALATGDQGYKYSGPAGMRVMSSLVNGINAGNELIWKEEPNYVKVVKAMVDIGGFFGMPASEINRALNAYDKMQRGQIDEDDAIRAAIFGVNK